MKFKDLTGDEKVARIEAWRAGKTHEDKQVESYQKFVKARKARIQKVLVGVLRVRAMRYSNKLSQI